MRGPEGISTCCSQISPDAATRRAPPGVRLVVCGFEWLAAPIFAAIFIGAVIFVILNLLPIFALIALAIIASRLLFGVRFRRHHWHGRQRLVRRPAASLVT